MENIMGRQRVTKGQVFQKSEEKVIKTLLKLKKGCSDEEILDAFKELFPDDWKKIIKRYEEHERLTPVGKRHPMPIPRKYLLNKFAKYRNMHNNGEDLSETLENLNKPKPKFVEETPANVEDLIAQLNADMHYKDSVMAINKLAKFKCDKSIHALMVFMESNADFNLRKLAFNRLLRFGCDVKHPSKNKKQAI